MKTLDELATALEEARHAKGLTYKDLAARTGLTPLTVRHVLQGKAAVRATNLMALAAELGLELVLVPQVVAASLAGARAPAQQAPLRYGSAAGEPATGRVPMVREGRGLLEEPGAKAFTTPLERLIADMNARALGVAGAKGQGAGRTGVGRRK
ncbi:helix-turn-helix domain-containing protein [Hydrogenophaga sp. BPS33]|uniref:helix-turn-helix domain-containing protein n=1 Tax=Hydrogenophaga sp. BPS33 TaxID=2651974 RepID=UPI00131F498F|nr:helix-turn-helix transcriptional regulator [Hydrogenophaga sp. BPS33]QHE84223.1 helix-turn-helix transcriptional regulator [Hydrogenophaga sp. BPS33]